MEFTHDFCSIIYILQYIVRGLITSLTYLATLSSFPPCRLFFRLASFALEEFETSLEAFRQGQQLLVAGTDASAGDTTSDSRKYRTWIRKCEAELEAEEGDLKAAAVADNVTIGGNAVTADVTVGENAVTSTKAPQQARAPVSSAHAHLRIKFQYYQSYEKVTVAVLEKGLSEDAVDVVVGMKRLTVRRKGDGGGLLFDKVLHEEILPAKVKTRFMASKAS